MPADFTDLLENVSAPPMHVDAETVLTRGRRRRLRRRLYGTATVLAAAALVAPVAAALRADPAPPAVPAVSPPVDCASAGQAPSPTGLWLDSGPATATRTLRVRVYNDACQGLSVAVARGSASSVSMADVAGRPLDAFWVVEANGGGLDKFGKALPVKTTAVALLPNGQRVCGIGPAPGAGAPQGQMPSLSEPITAAAGDDWRATFAAISGIGDPQRTAVLTICEGGRVVEPSLRPLNAIPEPTPTSAG